jgi:hypothetical protein
VNKVTLELNIIIDQKDLRDMYRIFNQTVTEYTYLSEADGTFCKIIFYDLKQILINIQKLK